MNWQQARTYAERFVGVDGYEVTIVPHRQPDGTFPLAYSLIVGKASIPPTKVDAFFADVQKGGLELEASTVAGTEVWELR